MEENKPTYEDLEKELNEYKELLWQLSDEYKVNLGAAEKQVEELKEKCKQLEMATETPKKEKEVVQPSIIKNLGLPACILNQNGEIQEYNNKFKFLIELLGFDIEDVKNVNFLLKRDANKELSDKFKDYLNGEDGVFQNIFKLKNAFQVIINLLVRVYRSNSNTTSLALFIEISQDEIVPEGIEMSNEEEGEEENTEEPDETELDHGLGTDIAIFAEKYEVYSELIKLYGGKGKKNRQIQTEEIHDGMIEVFALNSTRTRLYEKLNSQYKSFLNNFIKEYTDLTNNEKKHCLLIKAGLTYKEIAAFMDISINGVKIARNRLRKKLNLENNVKTNEFIGKFE